MLSVTSITIPTCASGYGFMLSGSELRVYGFGLGVSGLKIV